MLNWTDLSVLMMALAGPFIGAAAAHQHRAGIWSLILFGIVGLAVGVGVGIASSKCSYSVLDSKKVPAGLQFTAYLLIPALSLLLVILVPFLLAMIVFGRT